MRIGAVPVPLSTMLTRPELGHIVDDSRARLVAISASYSDRLEGAGDLTNAIVLGKAELEPLGRLPHGRHAPPCRPPLHCGDLRQDRARRLGDRRFYSVAKLFFAFGLGNSLTFPLSVGATTVLDPARPTSNRPGTERPGTSGTPVEGYEVKLLDEGGRDHRARPPGLPLREGRVDHHGVLVQQHCRPGRPPGEWMRTGDVYSFSPDGRWSFLGRSNDMMKIGGIWVSPAEVENVLLRHPDVLEAAVVGSNTADGLETEVAFVVP